MEGAALFIGIFGVIAVGAWVKAKSDMAEKDRMFQAQKAILDKFGSAEEVTRFLESEHGKEFFDRLKGAKVKEWPAQQTANQTAHGLLIGGVIVFFVGIGLLFGVAVAEEMLIPAFICIAAGVGMLIAAGLTRYTSKKWNLDEKNAGSRPGTQVS